MSELKWGREDAVVQPSFVLPNLYTSTHKHTSGRPLILPLFTCRGFFYSATLNFGNGNVLTNRGTTATLDGFVAKFQTSDGNSVWALDIGGTGNDFTRGIAVDPSTGDSIITGGFASSTLYVGPSYSILKTGTGAQDAYVVRLSSTGSILFTQQVRNTR